MKLSRQGQNQGLRHQCLAGITTITPGAAFIISETVLLRAVVCLCVCVRTCARRCAFHSTCKVCATNHPQTAQMPRLCHGVCFPHGEVQPKSLICRTALAGHLDGAFREDQLVVLRELAADDYKAHVCNCPLHKELQNCKTRKLQAIAPISTQLFLSSPPKPGLSSTCL